MKNHKKRKSKIHRHLNQSYPAQVLVVVLMVIVFLEGAVFGGANSVEFQEGLEILDMTESVLQTKADLMMLSEPFIDTAKSINQFYGMASVEAEFLLDSNIVPHVSGLVSDIVKFYEVASRELANALDLSDQIYSSSAYAFY